MRFVAFLIAAVTAVTVWACWYYGFREAWPFAAMGIPGSWAIWKIQRMIDRGEEAWQQEKYEYYLARCERERQLEFPFKMEWWREGMRQLMEEYGIEPTAKKASCWKWLGGGGKS